MQSHMGWQGGDRNLWVPVDRPLLPVRARAHRARRDGFVRLRCALDSVQLREFCVVCIGAPGQEQRTTLCPPSCGLPNAQPRARHAVGSTTQGNGGVTSCVHSEAPFLHRCVTVSLLSAGSSFPCHRKGGIEYFEKHVFY